MKWVKVLIISSLAFFQLSACSLNSEDSGLSVARMQNGARGGLVSPAVNVPNLNLTDWTAETGKAGLVYPLVNQQSFEAALKYMMQTSSDPVLLGNVTAVAFKGQLSTANSLSLTSNPEGYLNSLKDDPSKIQLYLGIWDNYVGSWNNGMTVEPYSFYFGASSSGYKGQIAFNFQASGSNVQYVIFLADQYGEMRFDGVLQSGTVTGTYTTGKLTYKARWDNSASYIDIGTYQIGTCNLFKCS